jgi:EXS family
MTLLLFICILLTIPSADGLFHKELYIRELPIYRSTFIMILVFLGTGVCIAYFREYKINYLYIFGINAQFKMNQYQLYKIFLILLTMWMISFLVEILIIKHYMAVDLFSGS